MTVSSSDDVAARKRRKLWALADEVGLTRDERLELASTLLYRDITSWKHLDDEQVSRLLDAFEGWAKINWILATRLWP